MSKFVTKICESLIEKKTESDKAFSHIACFVDSKSHSKVGFGREFA